jgi:hypothetical protein
VLTAKERKQLYDQDGPLQGERLFSSVWREDRALAEAFVAFCEAERPREHLEWRRSKTPRQLGDYFVEMVAELEDGLCDEDLIDEFLDELPEEQGAEATRRVKEALGTVKVPVKRNARRKSDAEARARLRVVHIALDALWEARAEQRPYARDEVVALRDALVALDPPPIAARDLTGLVAEANACLAADPLDARKVYSWIWMLRAQLPHHAPVLKAFRQWLEDQKESKRCSGTRAEWLERLRALEPPDREIAARLLERAVVAPAEAAALASLVGELRAA